MVESLDSWSLKEAKQQPAIGPGDACKLSKGSLNGVRGVVDQPIPAENPAQGSRFGVQVVDAAHVITDTGEAGLGAGDEIMHEVNA